MPVLKPPSGPMLSEPERVALGRSEREAILGALQKSPPSSDPWTGDATQTLRGLKGPEGIEVRFSAVECRAAGCFAQASFRSMADYAQGREQLTRRIIDDYPEGPKVVTAAELQPSGEVFNYWILRPPDRVPPNNPQFSRRSP